MSDTPFSAPKRGPGRPSLRATEIRPEVRADPVRPEDVRPKKVRTRKGAGTDRLYIPPELFPEGVDFQWVTNTVLGAPATQVRTSFEVNAWEAVTPDMFDGRFDGMFMPKGYTGEIEVDGLVLMWRPLELTLEARAEERQAARLAVNVQENKLRGGQLDGVTLDTTHPSARANTRVAREVMPGMAVPQD